MEFLIIKLGVGGGGGGGGGVISIFHFRVPKNRQTKYNKMSDSNGSTIFFKCHKHNMRDVQLHGVYFIWGY